jgi:hypothetical protein
MNVQGKIKSVGSTEQKTPKFAIRKFVIETGDKYPTVIEFQLINDKSVLIDPFSVGDVIDCHFNVEGREYNGNVYNSLKVWKIEQVSKAEPIQPESNAQPTNKEESEDDLPF